MSQNKIKSGIVLALLCCGVFSCVSQKPTLNASMQLSYVSSVKTLQHCSIPDSAGAELVCPKIAPAKEQPALVKFLKQIDQQSKQPGILSLPAKLQTAFINKACEVVRVPVPGKHTASIAQPEDQGKYAVIGLIFLILGIIAWLLAQNPAIGIVMLDTAYLFLVSGVLFIIFGLKR